MGNQISYTLKYNADEISLEEYQKTILENQDTIRCVAMLPIRKSDMMGYEYLPEQEVSEKEFINIVANINDPVGLQDIDLETLKCAAGVCPL